LYSAHPGHAADDCVVWVGEAEGFFVADAVLDYYESRIVVYARFEDWWDGGRVHGFMGEEYVVVVGCGVGWGPEDCMGVSGKFAILKKGEHTLVNVDDVVAMVLAFDLQTLRWLSFIVVVLRLREAPHVCFDTLIVGSRHYAQRHIRVAAEDEGIEAAYSTSAINERTTIINQ